MSESDGLCLWCERPFRAHRGGSPQRFCTGRCRTAFWGALRRWGERAVSAGSIADIRNADPAACTLLQGAVSPTAISEPQDPAPAASAESADEAVGLLDEFLCALVDLSGDTYADIMAAIPEPLSLRLDAYIAERLEEADSQP